MYFSLKAFILIYPFSTLFLFNYFFLIFFFVSILADPNRVPYDLPEAESEPVAGFITEYSTIYSSLILLTEYANIIALTYLIILVFSIFSIYLFILFLFSFCLIRSTLNRLKFDELMTSARLIILPIIFSFLLISLYFILFYSLLLVFMYYRLFFNIIFSLLIKGFLFSIIKSFKIRAFLLLYSLLVYAF